MTRLVLLSDIHGNLPALETVMADMKQFAPDHVIVAGDLINICPFSAEVLQVVTENRWTLIRGNNEYYSINAAPPRRPAAWANYDLIPGLVEEVADWRYFIAGLPDDLLLLYPDAPDVHLCHARPGDCWTGIYPPEFDSDDRVGELLSDARAKTIFCGHTHVPLNRRVGNYHIINPGTVGVPLLGEHLSSYMIVDGDASGWYVAEHRLLPMDIAPLLTRWEEIHFVERSGVSAKLVMQEAKTTRLALYPFNKWMAQHHPDEKPNDDHYVAFLQSDMDAYMPLPYRRENLKYQRL